MLKNFRTYKLAVHFYRAVETLRLQRHLRDRLNRAASSVVLNLAEGAGRRTKADQARFYSIALGSLRECQAILDLAVMTQSPLIQAADTVAAHIFRLIQTSERG